MIPALRSGFVVFIAVVVVGFAVSQPVNGRVAGNTGHRSTYVSLPDTVSAVLARKGVRRASMISPTTTVLVAFGLPLRHQHLLNSFIAHEAVHGHYMTQSQFTAAFAPKKTQVATVERWALAHGLNPVSASRDGLVVIMRSRAAALESALRVHIRRFIIGHSSFYANTSAPSAPRWLHVQSITGLDNVHHAVYISLRRAGTRRHDVPFDGLTPRDLEEAYDMCTWQGSGVSRSCVPYKVNGVSVDGTNQTVGITGFGQKVPDSDFKDFAQNTGTPAITSCAGCTGPDKLQWLNSAGSHSDRTLDEQALDVEYIHGLAPHSHIKYWLGDDAGSDASMEWTVAQAASDPSIHVVSNSWGDPGFESASSTNSFVVATRNSLERAVAVGTTFYFSTGDNAADSGCLNVFTHCGLASYPASSPYVVAVGGTNLQLNPTLTSRASEATWNLQRSDDSGSGGGCAPFFKRPSWQTGVGLATCSGRAIPDISAAGDLNNSPVEVWVNGSPEQVGGTSVSASLISGMAAATNRYLALEHSVNAHILPAMGFAAPEIYKLAGSTYYNTYFHDVLCGSNKYPAAMGWDEATGWGSIDWYAYSEGFAGQVPSTKVPPPSYWTCDPPSATGANLTGVACPGAHMCHLVGASGTLLRSSDVWHWNSPTYSSAKSDLLGISCPTPQICYALGSNGWLQRSSDGGKTWSSERIGITSATSIACPGSSNCYVAGAGIVSSSNGTKFVRDVASTGGAFVAVSCNSPKVCYAIRADGSVLKTTDGADWRAVTTPTLRGTISSLSCPMSTTCYAVGTSSVKDAQGGTALVERTSDGKTWSSQVVGPYGPLTAVRCRAARKCDAVGGGFVLRTIDGASWNEAATAPGAQFDAIACPTQSLCYAAGAYGRVLQIGAGPGH